MIPEDIQNMKPTTLDPCFITEHNGRYYVYQYRYGWNPKKKKKEKQNKLIGKICPGYGFIPNRYGRKLAKKRGISIPEVDPSLWNADIAKEPVFNPGIELDYADAYELFLQCAPDIARALEYCFGPDTPMLLAITLMRIAECADLFSLHNMYDNSYAQHLWPNLNVRRQSVKDFLLHLSTRTGPMHDFCMSRLTPGKKVLIDGTCLFSPADAVSMQGADPAVRCICVLDAQSDAPQYLRYVQAPPTAWDFLQTAEDAGLDDCICLLDRINWTRDGAAAFEQAQMPYVMRVPPTREWLDRTDWLREHGSDGFEPIFSTDPARWQYARILPDNDSGRSCCLFISTALYIQLHKSSLTRRKRLTRSYLHHDCLVTNLSESPEDLYTKLLQTPPYRSDFSTLQRCLESPWLLDCPTEAHDIEEMRRMKPAVAFSDFLALLYWRAVCAAIESAGILPQIDEVLSLARHDSRVHRGLDGIVKHHSGKMRTTYFNLLGLTVARNKTVE